MLSIRTAYGIPIASCLAAGAFGLVVVSCSAEERSTPLDAQPIQQAEQDVSPTSSYSEIKFASPDGSTLCIIRPGNASVSCFSREYRAAVTCYLNEKCNEYELLPRDILGNFTIGRERQRFSDPNGFTCEIVDDDRVFCVGGNQRMTYDAGHVRIP